MLVCLPADPSDVPGRNWLDQLIIGNGFMTPMALGGRDDAELLIELIYATGPCVGT
jgi:hypothetical protein